MIDFAAARRHMVDGQVRPADVTDLRIISAMQEVPRERFAPPEAAGLAYLDLALPVGGERCLLKPMVLAKLIQSANVGSADLVLDVGSGTGHGLRLVRIEDVGGGQQVLAVRLGDHAHFEPEAHAGFLEADPHAAVEETDGGEVLDAGKTHVL